jgi:hypothetical protein
VNKDVLRESGHGAGRAGLWRCVEASQQAVTRRCPVCFGAVTPPARRAGGPPALASAHGEVDGHLDLGLAAAGADRTADGSWPGPPLRPAGGRCGAAGHHRLALRRAVRRPADRRADRRVREQPAGRPGLPAAHAGANGSFACRSSSCRR